MTTTQDRQQSAEENRSYVIEKSADFSNRTKKFLANENPPICRRKSYCVIGQRQQRLEAGWKDFEIATLTEFYQVNPMLCKSQI